MIARSRSPLVLGLAGLALVAVLAGVLSIEDHGIMELQLHFRRG